MNEKYKEYRKEFESRFEKCSKIVGSAQGFVSPSGLYKIEISEYSNRREGRWNYSRGIVSRIATGEILADVKRNISLFWHTWVEHPNGNEYLLCGEDYECYSVVNLTQGTYQSYLPDEGYQGAGFCWTAAYPSPDKLMLAVDGCIWACPYELVFYDFQNPDNLPYKELGRVDLLTECEGWLDNETFVMTREVEIRKRDGVPCKQLSEEEQKELDSDSSLVDYRNEKSAVKRPSQETGT